MKLANRCPKCGGVASHLVTDIFRRPFYKCMMGLTTLYNREGELTRSGNVLACETIIDSEGRVVTGTIAYDTGGKTHTLGVTDGKERR